jgi:adenosylmethionine-8-amino-7-oxononanoate aminotransferase
MFALDHWGVHPDIIQFAKGITSGYFPLGGIGVRDEIGQVLDTGQSVWMHAYTYSGHPVGCAVALRTIEILERERMVDEAKEKGQRLLKNLRRALGDHPHVGDVRGKGLMCAVEFVQDKATKQEFPAQEVIGVRVHAEAQRLGLFTRLRGDVFNLAPPYVTTEQQLDRIVEILREATEAVFGY